MALTAIQQLILETLSEQAEGYLCSPDASAFVLKGMDDDELVQSELVKMEADGWVEFYKETEEVTIIRVERDDNGVPIIENNMYKPVLDDDNNLMTELITLPADEGWIITDKGRKALNE